MPVASAAGVPAYYVTMPFTASAKFNLSTILKYGGARGKANYSIPVCSLYNGEAYVSCGKCNVTSLTAHNVTYGCFDISVLCPWSGSGQRRLMAIDGSLDEADEYDVPPYRLNGAGTLDAGGPMEEDDQAVTRWSRLLGGGGGDGGNSPKTTDDLMAKMFNKTDDGGGDDAQSDDEFSNHYQASINEFSALAEGIAEQLNTVLSLDWSKVDIAKALPVVIFVSALTGIIIIGFLFFARWDTLDRHVAVYLREYRVRLKRIKVKEDLLKVMHHSPPSSMTAFLDCPPQLMRHTLLCPTSSSCLLLQGGPGLVTAEDIALNDERKVHDRVNSVLHTIRKSMDSNSYWTRKSMSKIYADADDGENPIAAAFNPDRPLQKQSSTVGTFYYKPASPTPASFRNANGSADALSELSASRRGSTFASLFGARSDSSKSRNADTLTGGSLHWGSQHGYQLGDSQRDLGSTSMHGGSQRDSPGKPKHDLSKSVLSHDEHVRGRTHHSCPS